TSSRQGIPRAAANGSPGLRRHGVLGAVDPGPGMGRRSSRRAAATPGPGAPAGVHGAANRATASRADEGAGGLRQSFGLSRAQSQPREGQTSESRAFGVADPAVAGAVTQDYRGEPPSATPPERARVALVPGSGAVAADHPYRLLRRRLLVVCSIVAGLYLVMVSINALVSFTSSDPNFRADLSEWLF